MNLPALFCDRQLRRGDGKSPKKTSAKSETRLDAKNDAEYDMRPASTLRRQTTLIFDNLVDKLSVEDESFQL